MIPSNVVEQYIHIKIYTCTCIFHISSGNHQGMDRWHKDYFTTSDKQYTAATYVVGGQCMVATFIKGD